MPTKAATTSSTTASTATEATTNPNAGPDPVIIDLGKQKSKRIKQLRKGRGKLLRDIEETTRQLSAQGVVEEGAQPIIVLVREKTIESFF